MSRENVRIFDYFCNRNTASLKAAVSVNCQKLLWKTILICI